MNDLIIFIFVAIGSICMGFLLGFIVRGFTRRNTKPEDASESEREQKEKSVPKKAPNRNWAEVANLWRDRRNGNIIFQVENEFYKQGSDLTTKERELLLKVIMDFHRWLEPPTVKPSDSNEVAKTVIPIKNKPDELVQSTMPSHSFPPNVPVQTKPTNHQKGSLGAVNIITRALRSDVTASILPSQSMITQVDIILQEKLIAANMQKWAVRLTEFPNKGMTVLVGLEKYEGIDDVPYERVRTVIRESVSEWERRAENGELVQ